MPHTSHANKYQRSPLLMALAGGIGDSQVTPEKAMSEGGDEFNTGKFTTKGGLLGWLGQGKANEMNNQLAMNQALGKQQSAQTVDTEKALIPSKLQLRQGEANIDTDAAVKQYQALTGPSIDRLTLQNKAALDQAVQMGKITNAQALDLQKGLNDVALSHKQNELTMLADPKNIALEMAPKKAESDIKSEEYNKNRGADVQERLGVVPNAQASQLLSSDDYNKMAFSAAKAKLQDEIQTPEFKAQAAQMMGVKTLTPGTTEYNFLTGKGVSVPDQNAKLTAQALGKPLPPPVTPFSIAQPKAFLKDAQGNLLDESGKLIKSSPPIGVLQPQPNALTPATSSTLPSLTPGLNSIPSGAQLQMVNPGLPNIDTNQLLEQLRKQGIQLRF